MPRWFLLVLETGFKANKRMAFTSYRAEGALRPRLGVETGRNGGTMGFHRPKE
jgi:hypothetical protein